MVETRMYAMVDRMKSRISTIFQPVFRIRVVLRRRSTSSQVIKRCTAMKMENTRKNPRIQMSGIVEAKKADGTASSSDSGMKSWETLLSLLFRKRFYFIGQSHQPHDYAGHQCGKQESPEFEDGEPCQRRRVVAAQLGV